MPLIIEGELVAKSTGAASDFSVGDREFHQKFGNGNVIVVDGNKLTIAFDRAGEKRMVDSFVERVCKALVGVAGCVVPRPYHLDLLGNLKATS
jgi:hypothetical protein